MSATKPRVRAGRAIPARDGTTTQQIKAAWSTAPLGSQKRPPQTKKVFSAAKTCVAFNNYYRGHVVSEEEWERFLAVMRSPLPTTFSFIDCSGHLDAEHVQARFQGLLARSAAAVRANGHAELADGGGAGGDGRAAVCVAAGTRVTLSLRPRKGGVRAFCGTETASRPLFCRPLAWFELGWQCDAPRAELKRLRRSLKLVRSFVQAHELSGRLSRQEAVSMLPPLLLRLAPADSVLDLCAAPGSKTVLLLARLAAAAAASDRGRGGGVLAGCVVANDVNLMRCRRLRERLARCAAPGALLVCHAAQRMPGRAGSYERVLCDVPCSGDGTLRKNPDIWDSWQPRAAASMHPLQLAILTRGLQLLRPGGCLVYSTCSLSPVENEAVLAAA